MADILQTGISGLRAAQRGLATTSHNISNVNTDGFSRQRVEQDTNLPHYTSRGAVGTGTQVQTIQRLNEEHRTEALRSNHAEYERLDVLQEMTGRIDNLIADTDAGLSPALRSFFDAVEEVANDPANTVTRQQMLTQGEALVDRFQTVDDRLLTLQEDVNNRLTMQAEEVNGLAQSIAELNGEIQRRWTDAQRPPNDLLDQRDEKIRELSERVAVRVNEQDNGAVNVGIGSGQPLVTGNRVTELEVVPDPYDPERPELAVRRGEDLIPVGRALQGGGSIGGLLEFRSEVLDDTRDEIGRVATSLAVSLNEQHRRGIQFDSGAPEQGDDFFSYAEARTIAHAGNTMDVSPEVAIDRERIGELQRENYQLRYDAGGDRWQLSSDSGAQYVLGEDVEADDDGRYRVNGLVIDLPSSAKARLAGDPPADGDRFRIEPTREGAQGIDTRLSRTTQIAAAAPAVSGEGLTAEGQSENTGRGRIGQPEVGDPRGVMAALREGGALERGIELEYNPDGSGEGEFQLYIGGERISGAWLPYNAEDLEEGQTFNLEEPLADWIGTEVDESEHPRLLDGLRQDGALDLEVRISGQPDPGDRFQITGNFEGVGDNSNALRMAELMEEPVMDGGNSSFQEAYSSMVGEIGGFSQRVQTNRDAQEALLRQAEEQWEELSGVNLDEEAARMMEQQQAYQAAAQIITTSDEVFQEMLGAVRR